VRPRITKLSRTSTRGGGGIPFYCECGTKGKKRKEELGEKMWGKESYWKSGEKEGKQGWKTDFVGFDLLLSSQARGLVEVKKHDVTHDVKKKWAEGVGYRKQC